MLDLNTQLVYALSRVQRPGSFYATGKVDFAIPRLEVDGVGNIALPLLPQQVSQLIQVAEQAPYGKGEETLVDTRVRKTWQIAADNVHISGKHWQGMLDDIVAKAVDGLGVTGDVEAELYKMLVYDEGSFFVNHRDTEKAAGMFATLIVALPALSTGGELRIEHGEQNVCLDLHTNDPAEIAFAAFYADCVHEVLPITSGCRMVLVYNLCRTGRGVLPKPPNYQREQEQVESCLRRWATMEHTGEDIPLKLVYLLEHAYTPENLAFSALKNGDAAIASVMVAAAKQAECDLFLALVSVEESGSAEHSYSRPKKSYWGDDDDDDEFEVYEVFDHEQYISHWQQPEGSVAAMGHLPFEDDELCLANRLHALSADALHFHEATGNEGASFERSYHRAALVVWPHAYNVDALSVGGLGMMLPYLSTKVSDWEVAGSQMGSALWQELHQFAERVIGTWSPVRERPYPSYQPEPTSTISLLTSLTTLQDSNLIQRAIRQVAIGGKHYQRKDNKAILAALALLPDEAAVVLLVDLLTQHATARLADCGELLRLSVAQYEPATLRVAALVLLDSLAIERQVSPYQGSMFISDHVVDIVAGIGQVDSALVLQAVDQMLAKRALFPMDMVLIPAAKQLVKRSDCPSAVSAYLREQCLQYLEACIAMPLAPPSDWTREANFTCRETDVGCAKLRSFLLSSTEQAWDYVAAEASRKALANIASQAKADVTMTTIKRGSPHILRFEKTQASYELRVAQRKLDERNRAELLAG